ncbi:DUF4435 domain-containing protein [Pareuzebyella sediminis]|uniref:DUF4435 domain-containing protein n=1 Tax=Pareuzebyella sediminis TaxID=2607998 RepID=UPI0011EBB9DB|nr:DUF4435 domain-containing protein [Pareuzebyella sediminis]
MKDKLTNSRYANAVLMKLQSSKKKWVFLVEGKTDRILFSKFIISDNVLINSCDGKPKVIEIIKELRNRNFSEFLAVLDSDFDKIDEETIDDKQVFYSDYHDIEVSIIESNSLNVILEKYASEEKLNTFNTKFKKEFKEYVLELGSYIGYLKWSNKKDKLGLVFKPVNIDGNHLKIEKFIDRNLVYLGNDKMIRQVLEYSKNRGTDLSSEAEVKSSFAKHSKIKVDFHNLCNGHDLSYIIALSLKKVIGSKTVSSKDVENDLRMSYDSNCFKKTDLYKSIKAWERKNSQVLI